MYQRNGHFRFSNGTSHAYAHPHFTQRYYDYRYAPPTYVESYQPVDGYTWVNGGWRWDGYQWTWSPGYYAAVPAYDY